MNQEDKTLTRVCCVCHKLFINNKWTINNDKYDQLYKDKKLTHGFCENCLQDQLQQLNYIYPSMNQHPLND